MVKQFQCNFVHAHPHFKREYVKHFFILAGEASGDRHAARLMRALRSLYPGCRFTGIGGEAMQKEGLQSLVPLQQINVVGFWEVAKKYRFFRRLLAQCRHILATSSFDAFIPVDYPGFNLRLAAFAKSRGIPVCYYIAPQLWAWGRKRAEKLRDAVHVLMVVFPFEVEFFQKFGIHTCFVGHPLLDDPDFEGMVLLPESRERLIALLPGSRAQEVMNNLPLMLQAASLIHTRLPGMRFAIATSEQVQPELYDIPHTLPITFETNSRALMRRSRAGLVKTGTSTLEAALCGMPFAMMYKTSPISYLLAKRMIVLPFISLVNIIAGRYIVKEFIQQDATPGRMTEEVLRLVEDRNAAVAMQQEFQHIRTSLGDSGAAARAAECIARTIGS